MIYHDYLELAEELAVREKKRPKQTSLRRSVSTSYYAVFHALANMCADELVGWSNPWGPFTQVYRALDHNTARRLLGSDGRGDKFGTEVAKIGLIFVTLQTARNTVDYDPQPFPYGRSETNEFIAQARLAIELIDSLPHDRRLELAA